jgi:hypothetical protein
MELINAEERQYFQEQGVLLLDHAAWIRGRVDCLFKLDLDDARTLDELLECIKEPPLFDGSFVLEDEDDIITLECEEEKRPVEENSRPSGGTLFEQAGGTFDSLLQMSVIRKHRSLATSASSSSFRLFSPSKWLV